MTRKELSKDTIGRLGEQLVSQWLEEQGWLILFRRWYSRWGEIDIIARSQTVELLAFVEIKTRSQNNWDADGALSITTSKQTKLCQAAALFLGKYPDFSDYYCRFDVALVSCQKFSDRNNHNNYLSSSICEEEYQFILYNYIESAFDC
jgi:putative endonuclease